MLPYCRCTEPTLLKTIKLHVGISMQHNSVDKFDQKKSVGYYIV